MLATGGIEATSDRTRLRLCDAPVGYPLAVAAIADHPESLRLRELGFGEGRIVELRSNADPVVCLLASTRVAFARRLAEMILVCPAVALVR